MTFIDWSDSAEMLGLLVEYVADEQEGSRGDPARREFLADLSRELTSLTERYDAMSTEELIGEMRAMYESRAEAFGSDSVLAHLTDCIEELERIRSETAG